MANDVYNWLLPATHASLVVSGSSQVEILKSGVGFGAGFGP